MIDSSNPIAVFPGEYKPGCLPRSSRFGGLFPVAAERIPIIPRSEWAARAAALNGGMGLRPFVKTILDQDGVGSCAAEAATQAVMIAREVAGLPHVPLNPWYVYRATSGGVDNGSSIDDNLDFIQRYGIAPMSLHPREGGWRAVPSAEAVAAARNYRGIEVYDITSIDEMVSALLSGFAVVYGASGHAVVKMRYLDDRRGEDVNSWSENWGDHGFGVWASYAAVNWQYGAWALRVAEHSGGDSPA